MGEGGYRFVLLTEHSKLIADTEIGSTDLKHCIDHAFEARDLHEQKHDQIQHALYLTEDLLADLANIWKHVPLKEVPPPATTALAPPRPRLMKMKEMVPKQEVAEKAYIERSQKALGRLKRNLEELKSELARVK